MKTLYKIPQQGRVSRKKHLFFTISLCFLVLLLVILSATPNVQAQCTTVVWEDNFDGTSLDLTKWSYALGRGCDQPSGCGFGNGEEQAYINNPNNISVADGKLTITALHNNPEPGAAFSSAKIMTKGLTYFQYGKIEAKMKLSSGQGAWPAFWTLAQKNNWPFTGEIDIMEAKHKNPTQLLGTVHHYNGHNTGQVTTPDLSLDFHTYGIEWEKDEIRWYFDGALYHQATPKTTGGAWPFNNVGNPMYLILNLAVGGLGTDFTGNQPFIPEHFPTNFQIDYVRVYSGTWNVEFNGDPFVYKGETNKTYTITSVAGAGYTWTLPDGATIIAGEGTNQITVNFGDHAKSGEITVAITSNCETQTYKKAITVEPAFKVTNILKDWDANNNMTFKIASGALTQVSNPSGAGNVGRYVRNASQQYDALIYHQVAFSNASDFVTRRRRIHADIYTDAPIGTTIRIQLENSAKSAQPFPAGRHSVHEVVTTKQNQWETLEFEYVNSPDIATGANSVDQLAFMFAVETNNGSTYHIDNIQIGTAGNLCARKLSQTLEDFETNRNIEFNSATGTLSKTANPASSGVNTSAEVGKYIRNSSELYDVLFYKNVNIPHLPHFKNGKSVFKMQVNSSAPVGTVISLQLETSASAPNNYPTGRHSLYQGVTTIQNQWETIEFYYITALDALAKDADVNSLVFLFAPGSTTGATYYFDNFITEAEDCTPIVDLQPPTVPTNLASPSKKHNSVNLTWTASTDDSGTVTGYEIYVDAEVTPRATVTGTSATISGLEQGTTYLFKVRAKDEVPRYSEFSTSLSVTTNTYSTTLPSPWVTEDVGAVGVEGDASYGTGVFTLNGSGSDIWESADEFRYVYQPVTGDVMITARVVSQTKTDDWAKSGVMIRETTDANAKHVLSALTVANGLAFQRRATTGGSTAHTAGAAVAVPYWVRLIRVGNVFTSYASADGLSWTQIGISETITMTAQVYVGLAVTSHKNSTLSTVELDNVSVTTSIPNVPVTSVTIESAATQVIVGTSLQLKAVIAPSDASNKNVTWSSSNTTVATISAGGLVTALSAGNTIITVTTVDGSKQATLALEIVQGEVNLALGKTASTSSNENESLSGSAAVDGNISTRWSSAFADPQWIYVDLGATYTINRVKITWEAASASQYKVQLSNDATTWSDLKAVVDNTTLVNEHTGLAGSGRYIRIYGTVRSTPYGYSIYELEVYGTSDDGGDGGTDGGDGGTDGGDGGTDGGDGGTDGGDGGTDGGDGGTDGGDGGTDGGDGGTDGGDGGTDGGDGGTDGGDGGTDGGDGGTDGGNGGTDGGGVVTSIHMGELNQEMLVYPNPVVGEKLTITGSKNTSICIIDSKGAKVSVARVTAEGFDVSHLSPGIYTIIQVRKGKIIQKRFMKKE
jgi:beta-glucanase (GH16 family)